MNASVPTPRRSRVFYQILTYFVDHPRAQDTVEGILEWWLLEQHIRRGKTRVKAALAQLVADGLITIREGPGGRVSYRVNRAKLRDIRRILREECEG